MTLGQKIKKLRTERKMTQAVLSDDLREHIARDKIVGEDGLRHVSLRSQFFDFLPQCHRRLFLLWVF